MAEDSEVIEKLILGVDVRDRTYWWKNYPMVFLGSDAVRYVVASFSDLRSSCEINVFIADGSLLMGMPRMLKML
jgi:hypothetical protein